MQAQQNLPKSVAEPNRPGSEASYSHPRPGPRFDNIVSPVLKRPLRDQRCCPVTHFPSLLCMFNHMPHREFQSPLVTRREYQTGLSVLTRSSTHPTRSDTITGKPTAIASFTTSPQGSKSDGNTAISAELYAERTSSEQIG